MTEEDIKRIFTYHPPTTEQQAVYEKINKAYEAFVLTIAPLMPDGPGKTVAIRKLQHARHSTNAAVALEGKF